MNRGMYGKLLAVAAVAVMGCSKSNNNNNNNQLNQNDRDFSVRAAQSNRAEIDAAQVALNNSSNMGVKMFAQQMINDHTLALNELDSIGTNLGLTLPTTPDSAHIALTQLLSTLNGHTFDSAYITSQVMDHNNAIALFTNETQVGQQTSLKNYAASKLPKLQMHLQMADSLKQTLQ